MSLQVPHFQWVHHPLSSILVKMTDFLKNRFIFEKIWRFCYFRPKIHSKYKKGGLQLIRTKFFRKSQFFNFWQFFSVFRKKPKISNLSRDKAPKFQNNVILNIKNALIGGKKVKTQLLRRRGHRKMQKESYLTSKKL